MWKFGERCSRQRELQAEGLSDICSVVSSGNMEDRVAKNNEQEEGNRR